MLARRWYGRLRGDASASVMYRCYTEKTHADAARDGFFCAHNAGLCKSIKEHRWSENCNLCVCV